LFAKLATSLNFDYTPCHKIVSKRKRYRANQSRTLIYSFSKWRMQAASSPFYGRFVYIFTADLVLSGVTCD